MLATNPAGVAWVTVVVVTSPTFMPFSFTICPSVRRAVPSGNMLTCAFHILRPLPQAEEAAEESVTTEESERVCCSPTVAYGSFMREHQYDGLPVLSREIPSTIVGTDIAMPSETQKMTFFAALLCDWPGAPQADAASPAATDPRNDLRVRSI
jgi:hypothetical protein